jgi:uncharacterized protein
MEWSMKSATRRQCLLVHLCILALLGTSTGPSFAQQLPLGDAMSVLQGLIGGQLPPRMRQPALRSQQPAAGAGPSFDCNRAKAAAEIAICTHSDLAALDRAMAESYAEARAANPGQAWMLAAQQRRFRARRDACGNSPPCLRQVILSQIAVLDQGTPQPMPEGTNNGSAALPVAVAPVTAAPVSSAALTLARPVQCDPPVGNGSRFVCSHQGLRDLDARMVSTVGAILRSPTAPRDFEASQRAWMAQRDDCSNDPCVYSRYEERLSQIAAFVPDAGTPDLADAGTVAETRRIAAE